MGFYINLGTSNYLHVELCALHIAVELVLDHNFPQVIVESDSLFALNPMPSLCEPDHPYADVIGRIKYRVTIHGCIKLSFVFGDFNSIANWLARAILLLHVGIHVFSSPFGAWHRFIRADSDEDLLASWPFKFSAYGIFPWGVAPSCIKKSPNNTYLLTNYLDT